MSHLQFAPGEDNVVEADFTPSLILFWLKAQIGVSSTRIITRGPNILFGMIPAGYVTKTYPLRNVASVSASSSFSINRLVLALVLFFLGIRIMGQSPSGGVFAVIVGASFLADTMVSSLSITNNAGGVSTVDVSLLQKAKLEQFRKQINARVSADHDLLRHSQTMLIQNQQLGVQQQMLTAQIMAQNAALQASSATIGPDNPTSVPPPVS